MSETIIGTVKTIINSFDNGYCVFSVKPDKTSKIIKACGTSVDISKGIRVILNGDFENNSKYGEQFKCKNIEIDKKDKEIITAERFLSSGCITGIGETKAREIVSKYGTDLESIFKDKNKLISIKGITERNVFKIMNSFRQNKYLYKIYKIVNGDITIKQAEAIYKKYKDEAEKKILDNPYIVIYDLDNFGFKKADALAKKIGIKSDSPERIMAGITYSVKEAIKDGHCFLYSKDVEEKTIDLLFPLSEMLNIYYLDVLKVAIPNEKIQWDESSLKNLLDNHTKILKNIVDNWEIEKKREEYVKKQKLDEYDITTIDTFVNKQKNIKNIFLDLLNACCLDVSNKNIKEAYDIALEDKTKILICDKDVNGTTRYFEKSAYLVEMEIAEIMATSNLKTPGIIVSDETIEHYIKEYEEKNGRALNKEQKDDIYTSCKNKISVSTGGPGRGKTTVIEVTANSWIASGGEVLLLAPTGRAAQRMAESTGFQAKTIHRELGEAEFEWMKDYNSRLLVIVDEVSMMDLWLARKLLKTMHECSFLFSGDKDQLPSVGIGNFLEDILKSNVIPVTYLLHCYRNAGSILQNSDIINSGGRVKDLKVDNHFKMYLSNDGETTQSNIITIYKAALKKYALKDIVVLTPRREMTKTSVTELNRILQNIVNPRTKDTVQLMNFRLGDRVIQLKNNYQIKCIKNGFETMGVFNGETGTITNIDVFNEKITVEFDDGKIGFYEAKNIALKELDLGYVITMHKSQGSEFPCIIFALTNADYILLYRKIVYTAESRAQKMAYFCGSASALQRAMSNAIYQIRNTVLAERLNQFNDYLKNEGQLEA